MIPWIDPVLVSTYCMKITLLFMFLSHSNSPVSKIQSQRTPWMRQYQHESVESPNNLWDHFKFGCAEWQSSCSQFIDGGAILDSYADMPCISPRETSALLTGWPWRLRHPSIISKWPTLAHSKWCHKLSQKYSRQYFVVQTVHSRVWKGAVSGVTSLIIAWHPHYCLLD